MEINPSQVPELGTQCNCIGFTLVSKAVTTKICPGDWLGTGIQSPMLNKCWNPEMSLSESNSQSPKQLLDIVHLLRCSGDHFWKAVCMATWKPREFISTYVSATAGLHDHKHVPRVHPHPLSKENQGRWLIIIPQAALINYLCPWLCFRPLCLVPSKINLLGRFDVSPSVLFGFDQSLTSCIWQHWHSQYKRLDVKDEQHDLWL